MDGSPNAQAKALLQLHDTPITADLLSPAEILHGHPAQGTVLSRPSRKVNIHQICQRLVELQEKQKEQFDRAHWARDPHPLKVKERVQFFQNKPASGPIKWTTGTVAEILECGWSYMIRGPNGRVYRRNWAHLKPICHNGSSFQDHPVTKGEKQPKDNSFQDHQARSMSFNNRVSYIDNEASYMDTQSMMFDSPETHQTPPTSPATSPPRHHSPRSPSFSPPASLPSRESSVEPSSEDSSPEGRKRHQSEPAFVRPHDVDQGLTPSLSALLAEMSPLAPYRLQWQVKAKAQKKIITHKWLLSRPFGSFQDHLVFTQTSMDKFHYIDLHGQFHSFQDHQKGENYELFNTKRRQTTEETTRQPHPASSSSSFSVHKCFMHFSDSKSSFQDHLKWHSLSSIRAKSHKDYISPHYNTMLSHPLHHRHLTF